MQLTHKPTKLLITGKSGCGKSTFFNRYLLNCWHDKIFIFDHEAEFGFRNGITPLHQIGADSVLDSRFVVYDPSTEFPGRTLDAFNYYAELVFECSKSPELAGMTKLFASDELQKIVDTYTVSYELSLLIETGRRYGIDTVFVSQQPNLIHNRLRNQLTEVTSFSHIDSRAVEFLLDLGFAEEELRALADLEFLDLDLRSLQMTRGILGFDKPTQIVSARNHADDLAAGNPDRNPDPVVQESAIESKTNE